MGKPYSQDLRERVMAAVDPGTGAYAAAPVFRVSNLQALPYFLLSVQSWVYVPIQENPAIGGGSPLTWSITTEWFFYFLYPVVVGGILAISLAIYAYYDGDSMATDVIA
jgi:peptidoglycan/LPS O-acetylase OafA/YrhL